jgi:hypothetical protein
MIASRKTLPVEVEQFIARLTAAAYEVALRQGHNGSFVDLQLGMWGALRQAALAELAAEEDPAWQR